MCVDYSPRFWRYQFWQAEKHRPRSQFGRDFEDPPSLGFGAARQDRSEEDPVKAGKMIKFSG